MAPVDGGPVSAPWRRQGGDQERGQGEGEEEGGRAETSGGEKSDGASQAREKGVENDGPRQAKGPLKGKAAVLGVSGASAQAQTVGQRFFAARPAFLLATTRTASSIRRARVSGFLASSIASTYSRWCV